MNISGNQGIGTLILRMQLDLMTQWDGMMGCWRIVRPLVIQLKMVRSAYIREQLLLVRSYCQGRE